MPLTLTDPFKFPINKNPLFLSLDICQQGLFRKSGQLSRQRILREKLSRGEHLEEELATNVYTVHDCASLLKSFLAELPEPLLTERHFATYCKIPGNTSYCGNFKLFKLNTQAEGFLKACFVGGHIILNISY